MARTCAVDPVTPDLIGRAVAIPELNINRVLKCGCQNQNLEPCCLLIISAKSVQLGCKMLPESTGFQHVGLCSEIRSREWRSMVKAGCMNAKALMLIVANNGTACPCLTHIMSSKHFIYCYLMNLVF